MKRIAVVSFAACFLSASAALAQDAAPALAAPACMINNMPVNADALAIANDIIKMTDAGNRFTAIVDAVMPQMTASLKQRMPTLSDEALAAFRSAFHDEMLKGVPDVIAQMACVYARHYTLDEIRGLAEFYKTPLGQKMLSTAPAIAGESLALGTAWGRQMGTAAAQKAMESLRAKGMKI